MRQLAGRPNYEYLVEEGKPICQRFLQLVLLPYNREPLRTIEGVPRNGHGIEENGFVQKAAACHLVLMCHTEIFQLLCQKAV